MDSNELVNGTAQDFIDFFEKIPDERWRIGQYFDEGTNTCCAQGLLGTRVEFDGVRRTLASSKLIATLHPWANVVEVNDGIDLNYQQVTPKERIIAALKDAKSRGF